VTQSIVRLSKLERLKYMNRILTAHEWAFLQPIEVFNEFNRRVREKSAAFNGCLNPDFIPMIFNQVKEEMENEAIQNKA